MECGTFPTSPGQIEASAMCDVSRWMRFNVLHFHLPLDMCVFAVLNLPYQHPLGDRAALSPAVHQGLHGHSFPFMGKNHTGCPLRAGMQMLKGLEHFLLWGHPDCPAEIWPQCQELPGGFLLSIAYNRMSKWSLKLAVCFHISAHFPQIPAAYASCLLRDSCSSLVKDLEYLSSTMLFFFWLNKNLCCAGSRGELQQKC